MFEEAALSDEDIRLISLFNTHWCRTHLTFWSCRKCLTRQLWAMKVFSWYPERTALSDDDFRLIFLFYAQPCRTHFETFCPAEKCLTRQLWEMKIYGWVPYLMCNHAALIFHLFFLQKMFDEAALTLLISLFDAHPCRYSLLNFLFCRKCLTRQLWALRRYWWRPLLPD